MASDFTVDELLAGRPHAIGLYRALEQRINALGAIERVVTKTQVSFGARRKFAWVWVTPPSRKRPEGTLMLTLDLTRRVDHPLFTSVQETYPGKWTHQLPVADDSAIRIVEAQGWLFDAYEYGTRERRRRSPPPSPT